MASERDVTPAEIQRRINELVDRGLLERRLNETTGEWEYRRTPLGYVVQEEIDRHG